MVLCDLRMLAGLILLFDSSGWLKLGRPIRLLWSEYSPCCELQDVLSLAVFVPKALNPAFLHSCMHDSVLRHIPHITMLQGPLDQPDSAEFGWHNNIPMQETHHSQHSGRMTARVHPC